MSMTKKQRLGELLVQKGLVSEEQISEALRLQVGGNRRLGYLLIKMGLINDSQLLETLSDQLDLPIMNITDQFSQEVRRIVPRYLCRKYSLIPLSRQENNILSVAMIDPLDDEAITDIENYTGMAVKPCLAGHKDISTGISHSIPFSLKDVFNPQVYGIAAKTATAIALVLVITLGFMAQRNMYIEKYGTVSIVGDSKVFKNHDLIIGYETDGKTSLLGRGAYAKGYYSVTFDNLDLLKNFIEQKKKNFSERQYEWLFWVIDQKLSATVR